MNRTTTTILAAAAALAFGGANAAAASASTNWHAIAVKVARADMKVWVNSPPSPYDDAPSCSKKISTPVLRCPYLYMRDWTYAIDGTPKCTGSHDVKSVMGTLGHVFRCTEVFRSWDGGTYNLPPKPNGTATRVVTVSAPTSGPEIGYMQITAASPLQSCGAPESGGAYPCPAGTVGT